MNLLIIGAGAIGCLVGGMVALQHDAKNVRVTLVGRPAVEEAVRQRPGLLLASHKGEQQVKNVQIFSTTAQAFAHSPHPFDAAILTVKSYDTEAAINQLMQAAHKHRQPLPVVVSLQNGVGNEQVIAKMLSPAHVIAGIIATPVDVQAPGRLFIEKERYDLGLSRWHPAVPQTRFDALQSVLQRAGFSAVAYANPHALKWTRLLMTMLGNATCAILGLAAQQIFADPALANLEVEAWREAWCVMRAAKIKPVNIGSHASAMLAPVVRFGPNVLARQLLGDQARSIRGGKMPGLWQDLLQEKRHSEVAWLNGAVVVRGKQLGVRTPINALFTDVLLDLVRRNEHWPLWQNGAMRLLAAAEEYRDM
ncbi:MAG: 2-dehydropantoate 2-reductase [Caldilineaceae bacterium]